MPKGPLAYEQRRVDLQLFVLCLLALGDTAPPQVLCFTIVWDTLGKEKVAKWSSAPASILEDFS